MSVLSECPQCHLKQSTKNKLCKCGLDLDQAKKSKKVKYWITYRMPDGKQKKECVGYSISEARDADGKRKVQKRENRIFEILPEAKMTFNELTGWYEKLSAVKALKSYKNVQLCLKNFNKVFGDIIVNTIKPMDLQEYQERRIKEGKSPATVDMEICIARTVINKAFYNDMVSGHTLKAFQRVDRKLKKGSNARKRTLTFSEYLSLYEAAPVHIKAILEIGFFTGMRLGEIRELQWKHVDRKKGFINLPAHMTKEGKDKKIPINDRVETVLSGLVRSLTYDTVILYRGNPIQHKTGVKKGLAAACKKAGIPYGRNEENGFTFHDIRRTVKTNMMNAGIDKAIRDTILGHSLQGMDVHYIVPSDEMLTKAMAQYTAWVENQIEEQIKKQGNLGNKWATNGRK